MRGSEFWPAGVRLAVEATVTSLAISVVMTGAVFLMGAPYPQVAEAADAVSGALREGSEALLPKEAAAADAPTPVPEEDPVPAAARDIRVRVGVFSVRENAAGLMAQLRTEGYWPELSVQRTSRGTELYSVYAGSYGLEADALAAVERLRESGRDVYIERGGSGSGAAPAMPRFDSANRD